MNTTTIWQTAAGDRGRDYSDLFLRHGLVFLGGAEDSQRVESLNQVSDGDLLLLKRGLGEVLAAGRAVSRNGVAYGADEQGWLSDVDGWNLKYFRHVEWHRPAAPVPATGLTRGTLKRSNQTEHRALAERIIADYPALPAAAPPAPTKRVSDDVIIDFLIREGLRPSSAEDLTSAFRRIRLLGRYYYDHCNWGEVLEHETRAFLVLPLFIALGWSEQQMKIELARTDLACFERPFVSWEERSACQIILEAKGFEQGLGYAPEQAVGYTTRFPECRVVVVSNGYCYKVFERPDSGEFGKTPSAYLNLLDPRERYPLDPEHVDGALGVFRTLLPGSVRR